MKILCILLTSLILFSNITAADEHTKLSGQVLLSEPNSKHLSVKQHNYQSQVESFYRQRQNTKKKFYDTQPALVVREAFSNLIKKPVRGIKKLIKRIRKKKDKKEKDSINIESMFECKDCASSKAPEVDANPIFSVLKSMQECSAWDDDPSKDCSCEEICPLNLDIFKHRDYKNPIDQAQSVNMLHFRNSPDFNKVSNYKFTEGFCWGHASATQSMNRLAFFRPQAKPLDKKGRVIPVGSKKYEKFYKKIIEDILFDHKPRVIPGFKDLNSFSQTAPFDKILANRVARIWKNQILDNWQTKRLFINAATRLDTLGANKNQSALKEIQQRLDMGFSPQVIYNFKNKPIGHVVKASAYFTDKEGHTVLCLQDNGLPANNQVVRYNSTSGEQLNCYNKMIFHKNGKVYEELFSSSIREEVGQIEIAFNEDRNLTKQMTNLQKMCKQLHCQ